MTFIKAVIASLILTLWVGQGAVAGVKAGDQAPDFELVGHDGKMYKLSDVLKDGKHVVLEWFNEECPYVDKHYSTGNMQGLQQKYVGDDVVWFSIISSAKGKQGYRDAGAATKMKEDIGMVSNAILLDPAGDVGKAYAAKTTPHMFVIKPDGQIVYDGAIDDNSSYRAETVKTANNYVTAALDATLAGKKVAMASTKPYGCSVKYAR